MANILSMHAVISDLDGEADTIEIKAIADGSGASLTIMDETITLSAEDLSALICALLSVDGFMERVRSEQSETVVGRTFN